MKYLVVQSDDFGMCHSVNAGILRGFREGILTQSTLMAPAPWFDEAAALARENNIPVGVHLTSNCDFDRYKWRPLTNARSLVGPDGTFLHDSNRTMAQANREEWLREYLAQVQRVRDCGIEPTHIDTHMGPIPDDLVAEVCRRTGLKTRNSYGENYRDVMLPIASRLSFGAQPAAERRERLRAWLEGLGDGWHLLTGHLAEPSEELRAMCSPDWPARPWTENIRKLDLEMVLDPEWPPLLRRLGIELRSFRDMKL